MPDARLKAMLAMAPKQVPPVSRNDDPQVFPAKGERKMRVALMTGCAQRALNTDINDATIRLLTRLGCDVVIAEGQGCCGALTHHMGKTAESHATAAKNIRAWHREMDGRGAGCRRDQHLGLRHDREGLRPHVPQRGAGGGGEGGERDRHGCLGSADEAGPARRRAQGAEDRLSRGLFAAAWAADQDLSQGPAETGRVQGERAASTATCAAARRGPTT
jgi:hypothetical protein